MSAFIKSFMPRWVPTSELELYNAEAAILGPIRPMICQRTVAGLNTIASLHEKVGADALASPAEDAEEVPSSPPTTPVEAVAEAASPFEAAATSPSAAASPITAHRMAGAPTCSVMEALSSHQQATLRPLDKDNYTSVVFVHGYAGGVANWLPIWKTMAHDYDTYAFDIPGFGRNERPKDVLPFASAQHAIDWYVAQFEQWFDAMRIGLEGMPEGYTGPRPAGRKIILVAHSFGGYLCSHLMMRHPNLVDHLVLIDAWGINRYAPRTAEEEAKRREKMSPIMIFLDDSLEGIYWGKLLSYCGPMAQRLLPIVRPEFADTWAPFLEDPKHFYDYSYHCNVKQPFIGEAAFEAIRTKEAIAATPLPLVDRTHLLPFASEALRAKRIAALEEERKGASGAEGAAIPSIFGTSLAADKSTAVPAIAGEDLQLRAGFKVTMLYGGESWLKHPHLDEFVAQLREHNGLDVSFAYIDKAGHMPLVDNMPMFLEELRKRL